MWQQIDSVGSEFCNLLYVQPDWYLNGTAVTILSNQPTLVEYQIRCDEAWRTRHVQVKMQFGRDRRTLKLTRDEEDTWKINGRDKYSLGQCTDVDLEITPATNTLPIRRMNLAVGESAEVFAAWIRFPQLTIEALAQRYTRLSETRYKYESRDSAFVTEIEVDTWGVVIDYPNYWKRTGTCSCI